jgi:hypothetical protein
MPGAPSNFFVGSTYKKYATVSTDALLAVFHSHQNTH